MLLMLCFIDRLKIEIQNVVMVHRPSTLDFACVLAVVQEEAAAASKRKNHWHGDPSVHRAVPKQDV